MSRSDALGIVAAIQLLLGIAGMALAVRRRHPYHVGRMQGTPDSVGRDALFNGTALSAPVWMLVAQAVAIALVVSDAWKPAHWVLGGLGLAMVAGYLGETHGRELLRPSGFDPLETPLLVLAILLSAAMAALGL